MSFGIEFPFGIGIRFLLMEIRPSRYQVCIIIEIYNRIVLNNTRYFVRFFFLVLCHLLSMIVPGIRWKEVPFRILYRFIPRSEFFFPSDLTILNVYLLLFKKSSLTLESFNI